MWMDVLAFALWDKIVSCWGHAGQKGAAADGTLGRNLSVSKSDRLAHCRFAPGRRPWMASCGPPKDLCHFLTLIVCFKCPARAQVRSFASQGKAIELVSSR